MQSKKIKDVKSIFLNKEVEKRILKLSLISANNELDAWDYQMADYMAVNGRYSVFPVKPLVRNIGFKLDSTHTATAPAWYKDKSYEFDVKPSDNLVIDKEYTKKYEESFLDKRSIFLKFVSKILPEKVKVFLKSIMSNK